MKVKVKPESLKPGDVFDACGNGIGTGYMENLKFDRINSAQEVITGSEVYPVSGYDFYREMSHSEMVGTLAKPGAAILKSLTPEKTNLLHMVSCILGETAELLDADPADRPNIVEELGDIRFYLQGFCQELKLGVPEFTLQEKTPVTFTQACGQLVVHAGNLFDATKKHIFYEGPLDQRKVENCLMDISKSLALIEYKMGTTKEEVLNGNIDKLMNKRYPDGYSDAAALARADKA